MDDNIIQVGSGVAVVVPQDDVYQLVKCCQHFVEAKVENLVLPVAKRGGEGNLGL